MAMRRKKKSEVPNKDIGNKIKNSR